DDFGDGGPVEVETVDAVAALDDVAAVAGIPLENVVAGAEESGVVVPVAVDEIIAVAAEQAIGAGAAEQDVVARAAIEGEAGHAGWQSRGRQSVVPIIPLDGERIVRALGRGDVHLGRQADDGEGRSGSHDLDDVVAVGAVDGHRVGYAVAGGTADRPGEID